jgi:hypothetical protein
MRVMGSQAISTSPRSFALGLSVFGMVDVIGDPSLKLLSFAVREGARAR